MNKKNIDDHTNILMSNYFKRKRFECGLTGKQMGKLLCKSQQHISRYEKNQTSIPLGVMIFFLKTHNFNLNDFFDYLLKNLPSSDEEKDSNLSQWEYTTPEQSLSLEIK